MATEKIIDGRHTKTATPTGGVNDILIHDVESSPPPGRWVRPKSSWREAGYHGAARRLMPGQWFYRPRWDGEQDLRRGAIVAQGFNRWAKNNRVQAAAYVTQATGAAVVVIAWSATPGEWQEDAEGQRSDGDEGDDGTDATATRTVTEKAAERARIERKLSGRSPVPGFDDVIKPGRAKRLSGGEE